MASVISWVAVVVVLGWLSRQRSRARVVGSTRVMEYPGVWKAFAVVSILAAGGVAVLPHVVQLQGDTDLLVWVELLFLVLGLWLGVEVLRRRVVLDEHGFTFFSPWRRAPSRFEWSDVDSVSYSEATQMLVVGAGARKVSLTRYLSGFRDFGQLLSKSARPGAVGPAELNRVFALAD